MECDYHYLVMSDPEDVVKYSTREDALAALQQFMEKQAAEGFTTRREPSGRFRSSHPDGRTMEFWIDDAHGDIVRPGAGRTAPEGLEIGCPMPSIVPE